MNPISGYDTANYTHNKIQLVQLLVDVLLDSVDQRRELLVFISGNAGGDHGASNTAGPTQGDLRGNEDVGNVLPNGKSEESISRRSHKTHLFLTQQRKVK